LGIGRGKSELFVEECGQIGWRHAGSIAQILPSCKGRSSWGVASGVSAGKAGGLHAGRYIMTRRLRPERCLLWLACWLRLGQRCSENQTVHTGRHSLLLMVLPNDLPDIVHLKAVHLAQLP
jgi:hypothetical protein